MNTRRPFNTNSIIEQIQGLGREEGWDVHNLSISMSVEDRDVRTVSVSFEIVAPYNTSIAPPQEIDVKNKITKKKPKRMTRFDLVKK